MEDLTGFGIKNSSTLTSLAKNCFTSLRDENDEAFFTYNDEVLRNFVRQSINGGRYSTLNQH